MPSVWFVSAAYRRFAVTALVLEQRERLIRELAEDGIDGHSLIVADDENLDVAQQHGCETVEWPNGRLGEKWNVGVEHACREGADFVVYIGSDDWVHRDFFTRLPDHGELLTGRQIAFVDLLGGRMQRCYMPGRWGVIPWVFPRSMLERCHFRPWPSDRKQGLDGTLIAGLRRAGRKPITIFHDPHDLCRIDFKSRVHITSYRTVTAHLARGEEITDPWPVLAERYPADLVEKARKLSEEEAAHDQT